jgi:hypothetical protein
MERSMTLKDKVKRKRVQIMLPPELHKWATGEAKRQFMSLSGFITFILRNDREGK